MLPPDLASLAAYFARIFWFSCSGKGISYGVSPSRLRLLPIPSCEVTRARDGVFGHSLDEQSTSNGISRDSQAEVALPSFGHSTCNLCIGSALLRIPEFFRPPPPTLLRIVNQGPIYFDAVEIPQDCIPIDDLAKYPQFVD